MIYTVYILRSKGKRPRFYAGMTTNLERRISEHNSGRCRSTASFRPWALLHTEDFPARPQARLREKYLKTGAGRKFVEILVNFKN